MLLQWLITVSEVRLHSYFRVPREIVLKVEPPLVAMIEHACRDDRLISRCVYSEVDGVTLEHLRSFPLLCLWMRHPSSEPDFFVGPGDMVDPFGETN